MSDKCVVISDKIIPVDVECLDMSGMTLTDEDIKQLGKLKNLQRLNMHFCNVEDISALGNLNNLTMLDLSENAIEDISALGNLNNLTMLDLSENCIEDISPLRNLSNLNRLYMSDCGLDDEDVRLLGDLKNLKVLELNYNNITNESLPVFCTFENLECLDIRRTSIDINGATAAMDCLPNVAIIYDDEPETEMEL